MGALNVGAWGVENRPIGPNGPLVGSRTVPPNGDGDGLAAVRPTRSGRVHEGGPMLRSGCVVSFWV